MDQFEIDEAVRSELGPGESLLWSGRPWQGVFLRASDALMIPFSILWGGFAIFWTVIATAGSGLFGAFGIPFVGIGLFMMVGRFFADSSARSGTAYAVTDRRLVIVRRGRRTSTSSTDFAHLGELELREQAGGRATISFGVGVRSSGFEIPTGLSGGNQQRPRFDSIDDGRRVYELIRDTAARSSH